MKKFNTSMSTVGILFLAGCGPSDLQVNYELMKTQIGWLESYCDAGSEKPRISRKASHAAIWIECSSAKILASGGVKSFEEHVVERGFVFKSQEGATRNWCRDGISLHTTLSRGLRVSIYYPGSLCKSATS